MDCHSTLKEMKYLDCPKDQFHSGEILSLFCLEEKCRSKALACNICLDQDHSNHKYKPLKMIVHEAMENIKNKEFLPQNSEELFKLIDSSKAKMLE
jgi:hypothetical protein